MRLTLSRTPHDHPVVRLLDEVFFPYVVRYVVSRPHILLLLGLITALEFPNTPAVIMLMLGNYTNVVSASASAIVLRQQAHQHDIQVERHDDHADALGTVLEELGAIKAHLGMPDAGIPIARR